MHCMQRPMTSTLDYFSDHQSTVKSTTIKFAIFRCRSEWFLENGINIYVYSKEESFTTQNNHKSRLLNILLRHSTCCLTWDSKTPFNGGQSDNKVRRTGRLNCSQKRIHHDKPSSFSELLHPLRLPGKMWRSTTIHFFTYIGLALFSNETIENTVDLLQLLDPDKNQCT